MLDEEKDEPQLWESCILREDGTKEVIAYAYGPSWVATALFMDDIKFSTAEAAKAWWEKNKERFTDGT